MQWLELVREEWWVVAAALLVSIASLLLLPLIVLRLPSDYFLEERRRPLLRQRWHPLAGLALLLAKNLVGLLLLAMGIAMLVLPGQGLLTMLSGIVLLDFPGKYRCERWLVSRGKVFEALNWLRAKGGKPALQLPSINS